MKKRLCTICARGGSKGVPGKNIRDLAGRPLISHSIKQAQISNLFDVIAVSSDSVAILDVAKSYGVSELVLRPDDLASDSSGKVPAIRHCVETVETARGLQFDSLVDLDATSPLRLVSDIESAVRLLETTACKSVITGAPARRSPYFNLVETGPNDSVRLSKPTDPPILRRQDAPACYDMNASIYVWQRDAFMQDAKVFYDDTRLFVMPENRSIDIDSELDFSLVELIFRQRDGRGQHVGNR